VPKNDPNYAYALEDALGLEFGFRAEVAR
jgi:hypothetical protein